MSHDINDCRIFRQQIQLAIEQGKLKFETPSKAEKLMKINQHPFPTNIVEVSSKDTSRVKLLTSNSAQNKGAADPKVQATAADVKGKGLLLEEGDLKPR
jgi:thiamine biosynthesis lipoprotein ApbE